jgi:primosomal protein N' (replication factor Y)
MKGRYVRVALPRPVQDLFHYEVPAQLRGKITRGSVVHVPFGRRTITGVVVDLVDASPVTARSVMTLPGIPTVPGFLVDLAVWAASYYLSPPGFLLRLTLPPPGARLKGPRFMLTDAGKKAAEKEIGSGREILKTLGKGPRTSRYLTDRFDSSLLERALGEGLITPLPIKPLSASTLDSPYSRQEEAVSKITINQRNALKSIEDACVSVGFKTFLLNGVTGSGKTEIYLRAAQSILDKGKGVLFLVPEISLTPLLLSRLERIAPGNVVPLHSGMTVAARTTGWEAARSGRARLVVGVRSGVFAPVPDLGLIIVDEEHDGSFRQEDTPSYNARDVAVKRAQMEGIPIILGSATPSFESLFNVETGKYALLSLPERVTPSPDPDLVLVDMSESDQADPVHSSLSKTLINELGEVLARGEQAILFLNRRGFAPFLLCFKCRHTVLCPNCSVTLTCHGRRQLVCHYCGQRENLPCTCPSCGVTALQPVGAGTQKVENALMELFPDTVVDRLDRDALTKRGTLETIYAGMDSGRTQILVGTQMLAKGHDFPGVTLAGILNAEQALDLPDFRSAERTFQIITQVAGRAGRGFRKGKVLIQSWVPEHYAIRTALEGNLQKFYEIDMSFRKKLGYPPFNRLGRILIDGISEEKVVQTSLDLAERIPRLKDLKILGPSPAPLQKIRNRFRWHLLVLADSHNRLVQVLTNATDPKRQGVRVTARVDPFQFL